ncbi:MAG: Veg family protein [Lachnospiraceae bacterium]|nr:Veg family protein [Lachnospiraceae bacterium]
MILKQSDIQKVKNSVGKQLGQKVILKLNKGRHRIDVQEGVLKEVYPSIFIVEVEATEDGVPAKTLSFSYTDVITKDVRMMLC